AILGALVVLALIFVGGQGRQEAAGRVGATVLHEDFRARFAVWVASLPIVREFPLFGVGLGAWPEAFFRFQPAPRSDLLYNAAHNDYVELLADVGMLGIGLAGWLVFRIAARFRSALRKIPRRMLPALAALVSGIIAMAVIEFFDFDLQVPANIVQPALLTGLALRMGEFNESSEAALEADVAPSAGRTGIGTRRWACVAASAGAVALGAIAMRQTGDPYPYDIVQPESVTDARNLLLSYPYNPETHRMLLAKFGDAMDSRARSREIETWQWLDPIDPLARDAYARDLLDNGNRAEAMRQVKQSVYVSPAVLSHAYLSPRILPWLQDDEKRAIEDGFKRAVDAGFNGAAIALGEYYSTLGRSSERAALLSASAARESDPQKRAEYLRESANAYVAMGELKKAGEIFRRAIDADPTDASSYTGLIAKVLVPYEQFDQVQEYIRAGIDHDVDACQLALSARGAASVGRPDIIEQTLDDALKVEPASYDCTMEMGLLYLRDGRNGRAMLMFGKATELRPNSAEAYMELATAAEKNYDFFKAEKAYDRAASLAPQNPDVAERLAAFKRKLAEAASDPGTPDAQVSAPAH
ncbi:MAG TPA: O-antigen ligase family protein, partial [Candidatus Acidoferrales bacterium]|nr:O-antigen ligase family protein [Candidatus Acidoferrales bacterium]